MKAKRIIISAITLGILCIVLAICVWPGGCILHKLRIGKIIGVEMVDEYSLESFNVDATGDSDIAFRWSIEPAQAGMFINDTSQEPIFHANGVASDTVIEIRVEVASKHHAPAVISRNITILDKVRVAENAIEIDKLPMTLVEKANDTYTFNYSGTLPEIGVGSILAGSGEKAFLRKVVSYQDTGTQLVVETSQATLEDYVKEGHFSAMLDFGSLEPGEVADPRYGKPACEILRFPSIEIPLAQMDLFRNDQISMALNAGTVKFTPSIELDMAFDPFRGMTYLYSGAKGRLDFTMGLNMQADGRYNLHEERLVYSHPPALFWLGPVFGAVIIDFYAGVELDAEIKGHLQPEFDAWTEVRLGGEYKDGIWSPIAAENHGAQLNNLDGQALAEMGVRGYIRPEVKVLFFGVVGPGINAEPYAELTGMGQAVPPCIAYELAVGLTSDIFVRAEILGYRLADFSARLLDIRVPLLSGSFGDCGSLQAGLIGGPARILEGNQVEFTIAASDDTGITYRWFTDSSESGQLLEVNTPTVQFEAGEVTDDTIVTLYAEVSSDNSPPVRREFQFTVLDATPELVVGSIVGPPVIYGTANAEYSVIAENDTGITCEWSYVPNDVGTIESPEDNPSKAIFSPNPSSSVKDFVIFVKVSSDTTALIERSMDVIVLEQPRLTVSQIQGASFVYEGWSEIYSVVASGDTGTTYLWSCDPSNAGSFKHADSSSAEFTAADVSNDTEISIKVLLNSDNSEPIEKVLKIVVKDSTDEQLLVSEIHGPLALTAGSTGYFSVDASGSGQIAFVWYCDPPEGGQLGESDRATTSFTSNDVTSDTTVRISLGVTGGPDGQLSRESLLTLKPQRSSWIRTWGTGGLDMVRDLAVTSSGSVYISGRYAGVNGSFSSMLAYISKISSSGVIQWSVIFPEGGSPYILQLRTDSYDALYIMGYAIGEVEFGSQRTGTEAQSVTQSTFIAKYSSEGEFEWLASWPSRNPNSGSQIEDFIVDSSSGIYIVGEFSEDSMDFYPGPNEDIHTNTDEDSDGFLLKMDINGQYLWTRTWGGTLNPSSVIPFFGVTQNNGHCFAQECACNASGEVFVGGMFWGSVDLDPGSGVYEATAPVFYFNGVAHNSGSYLSKFSADGTMLWARSWGGIDCDIEHVNRVIADEKGNVRVFDSVCEDNKETYFDRGWGPSGDSIWSRHQEFSLNASYLEETFYDLDPQLSLMVFDYDAILLCTHEIDLEGAGSIHSQSALKIAEDGNAYFTGTFSDQFSIMSAFGSKTCISNGDEDIYLIKLALDVDDPCGAVSKFDSVSSLPISGAEPTETFGAGTPGTAESAIREGIKDTQNGGTEDPVWSQVTTLLPESASCMNVIHHKGYWCDYVAIQYSLDSRSSYDGTLLHQGLFVGRLDDGQFNVLRRFPEALDYNGAAYIIEKLQFATLTTSSSLNDLLLLDVYTEVGQDLGHAELAAFDLHAGSQTGSGLTWFPEQLIEEFKHWDFSISEELNGVVVWQYEPYPDVERLLAITQVLYTLDPQMPQQLREVRRETTQEIYEQLPVAPPIPWW